MSQRIQIEDLCTNDSRKRLVKCFRCVNRSIRGWQCRINVVSRLSPDMTECPSFVEREKK